MQIRDRIIDLRRVKASDLKPNPRNWRTHPQTQRDALSGVLAEIGYADALLARELEGGDLELVDGHLRQDLDPDQVLPVLVVDLDEAEAAKLLTVLDPLAAMAGADGQALGELLAEIETESEGLQAMLEGLADEHGIDVFETAEVEEVEPQIDRAAELQEKWGTELGQLWLIPSKTVEGGEHRVLCGDSTKREDVERVMGGQRAKLLVTDPPWGVAYDPKRRGKGCKGEVIKGDENCDAWLAALPLFTGDVIYVWHAAVTTAVIAASLETAGMELRNLLLWVKASLVMRPYGRNKEQTAALGLYHYQHEPCWYAIRHGSAAWVGGLQQSTVWTIPGDVLETHGNQKPIECMARPIRNHEGEGVYDPFLGSGTTLVAAEQLSRLCYGIEIEPKYVAVILERLSDMGLSPRLEGGPNE